MCFKISSKIKKSASIIIKSAYFQGICIQNAKAEDTKSKSDF